MLSSIDGEGNDRQILKSILFTNVSVVAMESTSSGLT